MWIPETPLTHGLYVTVGMGGVVVAVIGGEAVHVVLLVRAPWATPLSVHGDGYVRDTRCKFYDLRDNPVPEGEIKQAFLLEAC